MIEGKVPPQAVDIEERVIASAMSDTKGMGAVYLEIGDRSDIFYKETHSIIYGCLVDMMDQGRDIDLITVAERLESKGLLATIGGAATLARISSRDVGMSRVKYDCAILKEKWLRREAIKLGSEIVNKSHEQDNEIEGELVSQISRIGDAISHTSSNQESSIEDVIQEVVNDTLKKASGEITGCSWGTRDADIKLGGMEPGLNYYLAARAGMGKTARAMQIAIENARLINKRKSGGHIRFYSLEMPRKQLVARGIVYDGEFDMRQIFLGKEFKQGMTDRLITAAERVWKGLPLQIIDRPMMWEEIVLEVEMAIANPDKKWGPPRLIIIDYLQLLYSSRKHDNRTKEIGYIAKKQKELAKKAGVPILSLSQLNRGVENRVNKRPMLSDLRETGEIEEAADLVAFLYRPSYYQASDESDEFICAKHRNGEPQTIYQEFNGLRQKWDDIGYKVPEYRDPSEPDESKMITSGDGDDLPF